jgi:hypothetical protein
MAIEFSCSHCGMRFQVSDHLAGKNARCKKCGNGLRIPEPRVVMASVAASGMFRMGTLQPEQVLANETPLAPSTAQASLRLAPIPSLDDLKPVRTNARDWEGEDSREYEVDWTEPTPVAQVPMTSPKKVLARGGIAEAVLHGLRKLSDFGYLISVTSLLGVLLGIVFKQRELVTIGAVIVVLTNVVRLGLDGFVLVTLAFKKGVLQGVLFLIPPFTFYFANKSKVLREALRRFLAPALPIAFLLVLFLFVPWLRGEKASDESVDDISVQDAPTP